jgi:hypothetical protein
MGKNSVGWHFGFNPVLSLSENNNLSQILRLLFNPGLRLYFLTETKIYRQKVETKAP